MPLINAKRIVLAAFLLLTTASVAGYWFLENLDYGIADRGDWKGVDGGNAYVESHVWVSNPAPFDIKTSIIDLEYRMEMNGVRVAEGKKERIYLEGGKNSTMPFPAEVETGKAPGRWASHVENGERTRVKVPVEVKIEKLPLSFDSAVHQDTLETDLEGRIDRSLSELEGNYTGDVEGFGTAEMEIRDTSAEWGDVSREKTDLLVSLQIHNPNSYPVPAPQLRGNITANRVKLADLESGTAIEGQRDQVIEPGETEEIEYRVEINNSKLDDWFRSHVRKNEKTSGEARIQMAFNVAGATVHVPGKDGLECNSSIQTGLLVDGQETRYAGDCRRPENSTQIQPGRNIGERLNYSQNRSLAQVMDRKRRNRVENVKELIGNRSTGYGRQKLLDMWIRKNGETS